MGRWRLPIWLHALKRLRQANERRARVDRGAPSRPPTSPSTARFRLEVFFPLLSFRGAAKRRARNPYSQPVVMDSGLPRFARSPE